MTSERRSGRKEQDGAKDGPGIKKWLQLNLDCADPGKILKSELCRVGG